MLLSDFGLVTAAHASSSISLFQLSGGTIPYMAPEQHAGKPQPASDQYALAVVVYEWLVGRRPFNGTAPEIALQHLHASPPPLRDQLPALPGAVEQVVFKALAKRPEDRFASVQDFANALHEAFQPTFVLPPAVNTSPSILSSASQGSVPLFVSPIESPAAATANQHPLAPTRPAQPAPPAGATIPFSPSPAPLPPQGLVPRSAGTSPQAAITPMLPPPSLPTRLKRLRLPFIVVVLLALLLAGAGSLSIYGAATGNWPWSRNSSQGPSTSISPGKTAPASVPGQVWHHYLSGTAKSLYGVAWSGALFVAVGESGTILTSPNGSTWTAQNSGTTQHLSKVAWLGGLFVAVGNGGTILASEDGRRWFPEPSGTTQGLSGVAWSGARFVVVGGGGTILTTDYAINGSNWTARNSGTTQYLSRVAWSGTQFVAVGGSGTILTSPDGIVWTSQNSGTRADLVDVAGSGTQLVVVGLSDTILTSSNGITWTAQHSPASTHLLAVAWSSSDALFVVVGIGPTILTSSNGITWTAHNSGTFEGLALIDIVWSGTQFVVVGDLGTVLTSP